MANQQEVVYGTEYYPYGKNTLSRLSPYWRKKFDQDAKVYWDKFYRSNTINFFKDRHYLEREFVELENGNNIILEVGCGVGNSTTPLLEINENLLFYSFDFSQKALEFLVEKIQQGKIEEKVNVLIWNPVTEIAPIPFTHNNHQPKFPAENSCDYALLVFVLSAVSPENMKLFLQRIGKYLKVGGKVLFRDYSCDDMAQKRFLEKPQKSQFEENFFVRGDGTFAYFFSEEYLKNLCATTGMFEVEDAAVIEKQITNRELDLSMPRKFIQAKLVKTQNVIFE